MYNYYTIREIYKREGSEILHSRAPEINILFLPKIKSILIQEGRVSR